MQHFHAAAQWSSRVMHHPTWNITHKHSLDCDSTLITLWHGHCTHTLPKMWSHGPGWTCHTVKPKRLAIPDPLCLYTQVLLIPLWALKCYLYYLSLITFLLQACQLLKNHFWGKYMCIAKIFIPRYGYSHSKKKHSCSCLNMVIKNYCGICWK